MRPFAGSVALLASLALGIGSVALAGSGPSVVDVTPSPAVEIVDQVGLTSVRLTMSEAVTIAPDAVRAWGVVSGDLPVVTSWISASNELVVSFAPAIQGDRVTLVLGPGITNAEGDELDGEVPNPNFPSIPTGDGLAGGVAVFRYDVLQGDANGDGVTNGADAQVVLAALGTCGNEPLADPDFDSAADLNSDGCVNVLDVQIVLSGLGGALPPLDGTPPSIASISRADGEPLTQDLSDLSITMSETLVAAGVVPTCVRLRSLDGELFQPMTTALAPDGLTIACHFDPPISSCGDYTVVIASSIVDLSGEFFVAGPTAPGFTGSTPPPTPILDPHPGATTSAGILLTGTIPNLSGFASPVEIRVQGIDQVVTGPAGSTFSIMAPLKANNLNVLYVSAISPCGIASAPVTTEVTRDNAPPTLTITFPADGLQTFDDAVSVGGFVSDTLNGFQGLSVVVNGIPAIVDVAAGQNGTWNAPVVPLGRPGQATPISVVASDALGNSITKSITVTRQVIPRNAAFIEKLSGSNQTGVVRTTLPQPIRVKVWKPDGTPWANKVVDFKVTQNDGRLSGSGFGSGSNFYQVLTSASGEAIATWRLGSTAGCGNNRVEATAKDVAGLVVFSATAIAAPASQINVGTGNNQFVETGAPTPRVLSAWVNDGANPGARVPVTFSVTRGGGSFAGGASQATVVSDATGHADVTFIAGATPGLNRVEATFPGNPGKPAVFTAYGIARDFTLPTSFSGLVFDDALRPIGNVKVSLKFQDQLVGPILTNVDGQFEFPDLGDRSGSVHVIVEGGIANKLGGLPIPPGVKFPSLGYESSIIPNAKNSLPRSIHLPPMLDVNYVLWDGQADVTLACDGIDGLRFTVKANSMTLQNGSHPTPGAPVKLSINKLHSDLIPMPMPDGVSPPFAAEFQPASSTFDPPVEVEFPNMSGLAPGATMSFLTFNHDTGEFEMMAPATVTPDGALIKSEPGTGLTLSGWHGPAGPVTITGSCASAGTCAQIDDGADPMAVGITINGLCANSFKDFIVGPNNVSTPMTVQIATNQPDDEVVVAWTVTPVGAHSGAVAQTSGTTLSFPLKPVIAPGVRPVDGLYDVPNVPVAYSIQAFVSSSRGTVFRTAFVEQDPKSIIRQEYADYRYFGNSSIDPPLRSFFDTPVGVAGYFTGDDFNIGNYHPPFSPSLVINGHMRAIAEAAAALYDPNKIHIESAYRNPQRNKAIPPNGGDRNSLHMKGGAVDMQPIPNTKANRLALYLKATQIPGNIAEKVLLERNGAQLWPSRWNPPPANWSKTGNLNGQSYTITFEDSNQDTLPDRVASVSTNNLNSLQLTLTWDGGGTSNPTFFVTHAGSGVNIAVGDQLMMDAIPSAVPYAPWTLDNFLALSTHIHGQKSGIPPPPPQDSDEDEDAALANWTFDVGGQSVIGDPSGAFFADNVSGIDGANGTQLDGIADTPIRVTGSTVIDGVTTYAFSEFFHVALNSNVPIQSLTLTTTPPPAPVSIAIDAPPLAEVGTPVQLGVTAELNDGSTQDVTPATAWTTYQSSNTALATVNANGLVTPLKPGTVFISAFNNAAAAVKKIIVTNQILTTTLVGTVQLSDGTPVGNAVVFTPLGGNAVSQASGLFQFNLSVGSQTTGLNVTAVATVNGVIHSGTVFVSPIVAPGVSEVGTITINPGGECDALAWLPTFGGQPGVNIQTQSEVPSQIYSVATFDDGLGGGPALYAGGYFFNAGGFAANGVARWDGVNWTPVGTTGGPGTTQSLVVFDDGLGGGPALYAGGGGIRKWNGTVWSVVGSGVNGWADALAVYDDGNGPKLYAGGIFTVSGQTQLNYVARLDRNAWSPLGTGMNGRVRALKVFNDGSGEVLVAGGEFTTANGLPVNRVARWNGISWSSFADGLNHFVYGLSVFDEGGGNGPQLFAGGSFGLPGGSSFARWNGAAWVTAGNFSGPVYSLATFNDGSGAAIFAGGQFGSVSGVSVGNIARWNGSTWASVGTGINGPVKVVAGFNDAWSPAPVLIAGGDFTYAGGLAVNRIAGWLSSTWTALGSGPNSFVNALAAFDDGMGKGTQLYVGGSFTTLGNATRNFIARWDGASWSNLANGMNGPVYALTVHDDGLGGGAKLYAGGNFNNSSGVGTNRIARWTGSAWAPLSSGMNGDVLSLTSFDDGSGPALYAGGSFTVAGGVSAARVAKWNGSSWSALGAGLSGGFIGPYVLALRGFDDGTGPALYAGGRFTQSGPIPLSNFARWNGQGWSDVNGGVNGWVYALETFDDQSGSGEGLYVGGFFSSAGVISAFRLARWDSAGWSMVGNGVDSSVRALMRYDDGSGAGPSLYVGGDFNTVGFGLQSTSLARWDGTIWTALAPSVMNGGVMALASFDDRSGNGVSLCAGGAFSASASGDSFLARWGCSTGPDDAPRRPQPSLARSAPHRAPPLVVDGGIDLRLKRGETLEIADESRRYGSIVAEAGSTIRLTHERSHLIVTNLTIEPGATFEWLAGTIEIDGGAWLHPYELTIGCDRGARLVLDSGAFVRAQGVVVCELGSLVGDGAVDAVVRNAGAIAGDGDGLRLLGAYQQDPTGAIVASLDELDDVVSGAVHACAAADAVGATGTVGKSTARVRVDVDADGDLDVVAVDVDGSVIVVWLNHLDARGSEHFGSPVLCSMTGGPWLVEMLDADGDGGLDLVTSSLDGHTVQTYYSGLTR